MLHGWKEQEYTQDMHLRMKSVRRLTSYIFGVIKRCHAGVVMQGWWCDMTYNNTCYKVIELSVLHGWKEQEYTQDMHLHMKSVRRLTSYIFGVIKRCHAGVVMQGWWCDMTYLL